MKNDIEPRALTYVDETQWRYVVARSKYQGCHRLAQVARVMLRSNKLIHSFLGGFFSVPFSGPEQELARQLAEQIPLGHEQSVVAAARGLQLAGIFACISNNIALSQCACYNDVVEKDVKPVVRKLLTQATQDWEGLGELSPQPDSET